MNGRIGQELTRLASRGARAFCLAACVLVVTAGAAFAQSSPGFRARSYINPFPETDRYMLHVLGDWLASGLSTGLEQAFDKDGTIKIINSAKGSAGLARPDRADWGADIGELTKAQPIHIAVLMMGLNDVRNIRVGDGIAKWGTDEWRSAYAAEADKLIKALKDRGVAVYWVGMPVMSNPKTSEAMALINDILRERSYINGTKYIDTWSGFTDQLGGFAAFGPDLTGQNKRLREPDGTSFTASGNRKLANYVEVMIRRDLAAARGERNISLAGDAEEQERLVPKPAPAQQPGNTPQPPEGGAPDGPQTPTPERTEGEQPAQGPILVPATTPPVQPETPAAISAFASGYAPPGETIIGDIEEGVTGLATVSQMTDLNVNAGERRLPVTERLYYKTLVKGEALKPKQGRADDFRWPRS
jgi:hypothetical protein